MLSPSLPLILSVAERGQGAVRINSAKALSERPFVALSVTTLMCHSYMVWFRMAAARPGAV